MAVTQSPADEACTAVVDRINASVLLPLDVEAKFQSEVIDQLEKQKELRIDVVHESEIQLEDTLETEDRTSHSVLVWIRKPCKGTYSAAVEALRLVARQVYQQLNNHLTGDARVRVREVSFDENENPQRQPLRELGMFISVVRCRVEVKPS